MKTRCACSLFMLLGLSVFAGGLSAQDAVTKDGLHFVRTPQPSAIIEDSESSRSRANPRLKRPVIQNFDHRPGPVWETWDCGDGIGSSRVSHGILTIDADSCYEFMMEDPVGKWHEFVDNRRGWVIETSLRVDAANPPEECDDFPGHSLQIWANDHTNLVIFGLTTNEVCISYPDIVRFSMDTTDAFHIYRIESKGRAVRVYVDGKLAIDHTLTTTGGGSTILAFGDGHADEETRSYWDYFSYDVFP